MVGCVEEMGKEPFLVSPKALGKADSGIWKKQRESLKTMSPSLMDNDMILAPLTICSGKTYCL